MDATSKPLVTGRWVDHGAQATVQGLRVRLAVDPADVAVLRRAYGLATGRRTIAAMAAMGLPIDTLLQFFGGLERIGAAWEGRCASMAGHALGINPGTLVPPVTADDVVALTRLPADPPGPRVTLEGEVPESDRRRSTIRRFSGAPISRGEISAILLAAYGRIGEVRTDSDADPTPSFVRRTVPSGGAMFPLQHDLLVLAGDDLASGRYRLALHENALIGPVELDRSALRRALLVGEGAAAVHVITFDLTRSAAKYGPRAYRYALLEAGHSAQNAMRAAGSVGLGSWEVGAYEDALLERLVGADHAEAGIATVLLYGRPG